MPQSLRDLYFACPYHANSFVFFFNGPATTEIYTLSLHDALPIYEARRGQHRLADRPRGDGVAARRVVDRKSTRLNSSHVSISDAVFCLKQKSCNELRWAYLNQKNTYFASYVTDSDC